MNYHNLSNTELVKCLAITPSDQQAWSEFVRRFHEHICKVIYYQCKEKHFDEGIRNPEDLAQEVYRNLVKNKGHALKIFSGKHENSIYTYLTTISTRIVLREMEKKGTQKRTGKTISYNSPIDADQIQGSQLSELISDIDENAFEAQELIEEINFCIEKVARARRRTELYKLIFKFYLYADLTPIKIAERPEMNLSWKRIENIISEMKAGIRECLQERFA